MRVLIAEDDPEISRHCSEILQRDGHEVSTTANGSDALVAATVRPPDLIILDLGLPGLGGLDVCRQLKSDPVTRLVPVLTWVATSTSPWFTSVVVPVPAWVLVVTPVCSPVTALPELVESDRVVDDEEDVRVRVWLVVVLVASEWLSSEPVEANAPVTAFPDPVENELPDRSTSEVVRLVWLVLVSRRRAVVWDSSDSTVYPPVIEFPSRADSVVFDVAPAMAPAVSCGPRCSPSVSVISRLVSCICRASYQFLPVGTHLTFVIPLKWGNGRMACATEAPRGKPG